MDILDEVANWTNQFEKGGRDVLGKAQEMLRTSYLATHTEEHLRRALEIFQQVGRNYDICK